MKILQISAQPPSSRGGGGIGVAQTALSLAGNGYQVDYVGPEIEEQRYRELYHNVFFLEMSNNLLLRIFDTCKGHTNSRYRSWLAFSKKTEVSGYDLVVMDFTKLNYCIPWLKDKPLLVRVHNVECDFAKKSFKTNKTLTSWITCRLTKKREAQLTNRADCLVVLTEEDKKRLLNVYPDTEKNKIKIIPVCVEEKKNKSAAPNKSKLQLLITGSLWFGENYKGILWFLKAVYPMVETIAELTIAGSEPAKDLKKMIEKNKGILLAASPETMEPYFSRADLVIAPVFDGAGMKVKVAEALSYGKPVVGTSHAFIGYQIENGVNSYRADSAEDFVNAITSFHSLSQKEKDEMTKKAISLYENQYSSQTSCILWKNIIESIGL